VVSHIGKKDVGRFASPNSSVAGIRLLAAAWATTRPVLVLPVKAILAIQRLLASGMPA